MSKREEWQRWFNSPNCSTKDPPIRFSYQDYVYLCSERDITINENDRIEYNWGKHCKFVQRWPIFLDYLAECANANDVAGVLVYLTTRIVSFSKKKKEWIDFWASSKWPKNGSMDAPIPFYFFGKLNLLKLPQMADTRLFLSKDDEFVSKLAECESNEQVQEVLLQKLEELAANTMPWKEENWTKYFQLCKTDRKEAECYTSSAENTDFVQANADSMSQDKSLLKALSDCMSEEVKKYPKEAILIGSPTWKSVQTACKKIVDDYISEKRKSVEKKEAWEEWFSSGKVVDYLAIGAYPPPKGVFGVNNLSMVINDFFKESQTTNPLLLEELREACKIKIYSNDTWYRNLVNENERIVTCVNFIVNDLIGVAKSSYKKRLESPPIAVDLKPVNQNDSITATSHVSGYVVSKETGESEVSEENTFMEEFKEEVGLAGYVVVATQLTNVVKIGLQTALKKQGMKRAEVNAVLRFFETPIGAGFLTAGIGHALKLLPGENEKVEALAKSMRVQGMAMGANAILQDITTGILPQVMAVLQSLPEAKPKVRVDHDVKVVPENDDDVVEKPSAKLSAVR